MTVDVDEARLDDVEALRATDPQEMLRAVATSAAQVRSGVSTAREAGLDVLRDEGRPRAVVVSGMGGSAIAGDVVAAAAAAGSSVPVVVNRTPSLPGWVGAADLVIAVSCSGSTAETLAATDEAVRRGCRVVGVAAAGSPLAERCRQARAPVVPVVQQLAPRASMWALTVPVAIAAARAGIVDLGPDDEMLEAAARRLEAVAETCRPDRESFVNPAKALALELAGALPLAWAAGPAATPIATRFGCQLAENAKVAAVTGVLPEAHHNQVVTFAGALAGGSAPEDIFRDRVEEAEPMRLRLVLLHDDDGDADTGRRVAESSRLAEEHGVPVSVVTSDGDGYWERLASVVGLVDYASVYLAIAQGIDPTPVRPIDDLKAALAAPASHD